MNSSASKAKPKRDGGSRLALAGSALSQHQDYLLFVQQHKTQRSQAGTDSDEPMRSLDVDIHFCKQ
eukprot:6209044-Pleurochrysis_carterae.AAC.1